MEREMKFQKILGICAFSVLLTACASTPKKSVEEVVAPTPTAQAPVETIVESTKYETLIYGQERPLVCSSPILAEGRFKNRPNLQVMWENYLYDRPEGIWGEIGGKVEVNGNLPMDQGRWTNACTVRLSHMLNQADHKIKKNGNQTVSGGNGDQYYYRIRDAEVYLTDVFGAPDISINDGSADSFDLPNRAGIVLMDFPGSTFNGHVTVWNGAGSVDGADIGGHRVLFWELPCFIPEDRNMAVAMRTDLLDLTP